MPSTKRHSRRDASGEGPAHTRVVKTLWPPQAGTLKQQRAFGERLLCVRYRHDAAGLRRYTTVEIIVDHAPVGGRRAENRLYMVRIERRETYLREEAKTSGARWSRMLKRWLMTGKTVRHLNLESRAVPVPTRLLLQANGQRDD